MKLDLTKQEIRTILQQKFGNAEFRIFYTESDKQWEARNNKKIEELKIPPEKISVVLYLDE